MKKAFDWINFFVINAIFFWMMYEGFINNSENAVRLVLFIVYLSMVMSLILCIGVGKDPVKLAALTPKNKFRTQLSWLLGFGATCILVYFDHIVAGLINYFGLIVFHSVYFRKEQLEKKNEQAWKDFVKNNNTSQ